MKFHVAGAGGGCGGCVAPLGAEPESRAAERQQRGERAERRRGHSLKIGLQKFSQKILYNIVLVITIDRITLVTTAERSNINAKSLLPTVYILNPNNIRKMFVENF